MGKVTARRDADSALIALRAGESRHASISDVNRRRIGATRILRLFDDYDVKATSYACGRALERNLDIARPVLDTVARAGAGSAWRTADRSGRARPRAPGSRRD